MIDNNLQCGKFDKKFHLAKKRKIKIVKLRKIFFFGNTFNGIIIRFKIFYVIYYSRFDVSHFKKKIHFYICFYLTH